MRICTHTHIHVLTHTSAGQSAWHQTAVHGQMRCVRAPCCQEADRKKKQTLSNGDMTCSPGRKLKQTINGPWSLQYSSKIPTTAPPSLYSFAPVLSHVGRGGSTFQDLGPYPEVTYFCHPLIPILLRSLNWTKWTTQHQYVNHLRRSSCTKGEWTDLLIYCHKSVFYSHHGQISNLSTCELGCKAISWRRRWRSFVAI